jgi:hypothetical protein
MPCVFCGAKAPITAEHVIPQWCRDHVADPEGEPGTHHSITMRFGQDSTYRSYEGQPATQRVRSVCKNCNNGWMSRIETATQPHLIPMIEGRVQTLDRTIQEVVATWLMKTALVGGSKFNPALQPEFYERFYREQTPGVPTRVWLTATAHREQHYLDFRPLRVEADDRPPPLIPNAFSALVALGEFAGLVVSWLDLKPSVRRLVDRFGAVLVPIWPRTRDHAVWPPLGGSLDFQGLDALANGLVSIDDVRAGRGRPNV